MRPEVSPIVTRAPRRALRVVMAVAIVVAAFSTGYVAGRVGSGDATRVQAAELPVAPATGDTSTTSSTSSTTTTTTSSSSTTTIPVRPDEPPPYEARYVVPDGEAEPELKQLAADIAYSLTSYEESDDPASLLVDALGGAGGDLVTGIGEPLINPGSWSRGQVIYPQLGGLTDARASVMVVTRQTVGTGSQIEYSAVRTLDLRFVRGDSGWEFESLASAGGTFESVEELFFAHAVASDPRIEMPDSVRLDIRNGLLSPALLRVMADLADRASYAVVVAVTGHPLHVFETERQSHHTIGRAIDIYRIGKHRVIDDRAPDSVTRSVVEWLLEHPDVQQVGSPWDLDGDESVRSFTDVVHQDHIHLAVVGDS